jgi:hypothetical protein
MCGVAANNDTWRRGKRNFMVCDREIIGIKIQVRYKQYIPVMTNKSSISLVTSKWRIVLQLGAWFNSKNDIKLLRDNGYNAFHVPIISSTRTPRTLIAVRQVDLEPEFDIHSQQALEREWTLLKLFSSEWSEWSNDAA